MIDWARERYDYVVIDTPPMMNLIDAAIIAEEADGAVLVVESGKYQLPDRPACEGSAGKERLSDLGSRIKPYRRRKQQRLL